MNRNIFILILCLLAIPFYSFSQTGVYPGTWEMEYLKDSGSTPLHATLQVGVSEKNVLYPAQLTLQCDSFTAVYQLLLVKKTIRELGISRNKFRVSEKPFSLGKAPEFLNGIFDHSKDLKGQPTLTISRLLSKQAAAFIPDTLKFEKQNRKTYLQLIHFLKDAEISLTKTGGIPWKDESSDKIISPSLSPVYFGLLDSVYLPTRDGMIHLSSLKKTDIVSVALNGNVIIDRVTLNKKPHSEDILLDTGNNILVLFAENFGNDLPNSGKANFVFGRKKFNLDFSRKIDSGSSFIAAQFYFAHDKDKDTYFQDYTPAYYQPLKEDEKLMGSILSTSRQLTLAIWDDAVEDGDSISININGDWIAKGFPVKKRTQYITVTLKPGPNTINFVADNLGSIPPNTSVLEIIDGKKRKSFMLETVMGENNLIKIFYELKPEQQ